METVNQNTHNTYESISPSARVLLLMKGHTNIPFARATAELISLPGKYVLDYENTDPSFWLRLAHFESRYHSIDQLLSGLPVKNILELSSGFSFRGLEAVKQSDIHYIDTDLPGIIEKKKELLSTLMAAHPGSVGTLQLMALNALDEAQFEEVLGHFPGGPLVIVNEGLLMYLNEEEKTQLCSNIHKILKQRGGYWITADVYVKNPVGNTSLNFDDKFQQFLEQHNIEKNKFDSLEVAETFFRKNGFVIDKEAEPDYSKVSALPYIYIMKTVSQERLMEMSKIGKIHTSWRLKIADE